MFKLTDNEKLVWAAAYAGAMLQQYEDKSIGRQKDEYPAEAVETAWAVVQALRSKETHEAIVDGWGEDDELFHQREQMLS